MDKLDVPAAVTRRDLDQAVRDGLIDDAQAGALWQRWQAPASSTQPAAAPGAMASPRFGFNHVLYYFGGMLAIGAMTLFMTLGWTAMGPWAVAALAVAYLVGCLKAASHLLDRGLHNPAGILATLAVCLVPLAVWAAQHGLGLWPPGATESYSSYHTHINWRWITLEFSTLLAGIVMLWRHRLPFMVMPLAVTIWYLSMDVAHAIVQNQGFDWKLMRDLSMLFGLATCALAVWVDLRSRLARSADFAFWLYLFGAIMFWSSLSLRDSNSEWGKLAYAAINVVLIFAGAAIGRRVFTVFGALGIAIYLGHLSHKVFRDSLMFPFALTILGLSIVALGILWQRHEAPIQQRLKAWLPAPLQVLMDPA